MRSILGVLATAASSALLMASAVTGPQAAAQPPPPPAGAPCNNPNCTPGIAPNIVLGSYCDNTTYYVYGVTNWGRLVFCGSPRRYEPRWFRAPEMHGVKLENDLCTGMEGDAAQAPDGLFLMCVSKDNRTFWERGDL